MVARKSVFRPAQKSELATRITAWVQPGSPPTSASLALSLERRSFVSFSTTGRL